MWTRFVHSRITARTTTIVLAIGVFALAALALLSTATIERANARVAAATETGDAWGHLFDHINLEEDMMHAYLATLDDAQRQGFAQTIGGAEPLLASLQQLVGSDREQVAQVRVAYRSYTRTLEKIRTSGHDRATLEVGKQEGEAAAAAVRQLVSAASASERATTLAYTKRINAYSHRIRTAATIAFSICIALLGLCSAILLAYQRRVERQAAANRYAARHDALTGLANRSALHEAINSAVGECARTGDRLGLLLIDLDGFKEVNDTLGHGFGDRVLQEVAARLTRSIRDCDAVARLGGDEFAVLLPRITSVDEAVTIARRLVSDLRRPVLLDRYNLEVGSSVGLSVLPDDCQSPDELVQHADIAMYTAKRNRTGVAAYEDSQNSYHPKQLTLLAELRRALDNGEIMIYYQPKVDTATGRILGVEALIRWQHPVRGLMGPVEFVPLAEQSGLVDQLTLRVLREALAQCRAWQMEGLDLPIAINVSAKNLADPDFGKKVGATLLKYEVPARMLTLEITETAVISNPDQAIRILHEIRAMGVSLAVDDFGTGYSSLVYLQEMPITELKIDRCFVSRLNSEANRTIVCAVLDLARHLHLQVVAEGVEDQSTRDELTALGCDVSQGFLFGRPLPAADLTAWVMSEQSRALTTDAV